MGKIKKEKNKIRKELLELAKDIEGCIEQSTDSIWEDGCVEFSYNSKYKFMICRVREHNWQDIMAEDLEQKDEETS